MNPVAEEILMCYGMGNDEEFVDDFLTHIGMPRRSGRYPWGSGKDPYQRSGDFLSRVENYKKAGKSEKEIADILGLTTKEYRQEVSICKDQRRMLDVETAKRYRDKEGLSTSEIGRKMGVNESTVRSWFNEEAERRMNATKETVDFLRDQVNEKGMVDVGTGVDRELNISKERLDTALYYLQTKEGFEVYTGGIPQPTNPGQQTTQRVLCTPGTKHKEIYEYDKVKTIEDYTCADDGKTFTKFQYPASMDSKRLMVRYDEDGGTMKDGIIEIRRGVQDLSLGDARYSQVRILVDDKKYLKGMAVYGDDKDFPPGVDVIFNTNKTRDKAPGLDALKDIAKDPDNPFGSLIKEKGGQSYYDDPKGKYTDPVTGKKQSLSLINKRADEGDWTDWQDALPSQFLGKQSLSMAKKQLGLAKADKQAEFEEICSIPNPTMKKYFLDKFADNCDSAAVHLKAAALPGQKYHVIIPVNSLKDTEVYAPQYANGSKLALVRYPHGGTFEIPILTVNNKNASAKKLIGTESIDAIGITKKNADLLSGADFDGDTVMCIPTHDSKGRVKIASTVNDLSNKSWSGLLGFDNKLEYPERPGMKYMKDPKTGTDNTQREMGEISNLITDMTLAGAPPEHMVRAVRHSMVVIDAGKHKLDYKKSETDHNISELKKLYQRRVDADGKEHYGGASTLLSRSKGEYTVEKRQGTPKVNLKGTEHYDPSKPEGALIYKTTSDLYYPVRKYDKDKGIVSIKTTDGKTIEYDAKDEKAVKKYAPVKRVDSETGEITYTDSTGKITYKTDYKKQKSTKMAEADDAMSLVSDYRHPMEIVYADYANSMKSLANQARKTSATTGKIEYDKAAKETYRKEVDSLMSKLNNAQLNTVREREAQRRANAEVAAKKEADPSLSKKDIKKLNQQAMTKYRDEVGAIARRDRNINITDREWEAIQAGAISETKLKSILNNTDIDALRERVTPRSTTTLSPAKVNKIKAMKASNFTLEQIAASAGVSPSTVSKYLKGVI